MTAPSTAADSVRLMVSQARALRGKYLSDPHRHGYHFVVPEGCHGPVDPNGALFWNGRYHCPDFFPLPTGPDGGPESDRHMILFISHTLGLSLFAEGGKTTVARLRVWELMPANPW